MPAALLYSNLWTMLMLVLLIALPIFIFSYYIWHAKYLDEKVFLSRYGNVIEGLWLCKDLTKRRAVVIYPIWFCLRRIAFGYICVVFETDILRQVVLLTIISMATIIYVIMCKPFTHNRINMLEIVNEVTNLLLLYHVILFSGMIDNTEERYLYGWSFIIITSLNLCMHLLLLVYEVYWNIRK